MVRVQSEVARLRLGPFLFFHCSLSKVYSVDIVGMEASQELFLLPALPQAIPHLLQ